MWYRAECERIDDPVIIAQELDIDYTASVEGITIPSAWVRAAVNLELPANGPSIAGLDVADDGPDRNVFLERTGPVVSFIEDWSRVNTTQTAWKAADTAEERGVPVVLYDSIGVGAGVRGTWESASERYLKFRPMAINVGESPTETVWPDEKTSKERFLNLRAEIWWLMRIRFEKTFEYRKWLAGEDGGADHPAEEMISIPNHPGLISDLSLPLHFRTETGKIQIESKDKMRRRGVKSPNFADALALTFVPVPLEPEPPMIGGSRPLVDQFRQQMTIPGQMLIPGGGRRPWAGR